MAARCAVRGSTGLWLGLVVFCGVTAAVAQARHTADRVLDLQVGGGVVLGKSDYDTNLFRGGAFYTTLDFRPHVGAELGFHQANSSVGDQVYERTYEVGARYFRTYGRLVPYAKFMIGRGVFNYPRSIYNPAYNLIAPGAGLDVHVNRFLNVRADYEYQRWFGFDPHGLTPQLFTFGLAYQFPSGLRRGQHY
jgi:hypothetical protein